MFTKFRPMGKKFAIGLRELIRSKRFRSTNIILFVWLVSRSASWIFFKPTISPDSMEYLEMGKFFASLNFGEVDSNRPFGYAMLIAFLGAKPVLIVFFQQIMSLLIALEIHKVLINTRLTGFWRIVLPITFLLYPLTLFLEFQILSEILTAFLLIKMANVVILSKNRRFTKTLIMLMTLLSLIVLVRPNVLPLALGLTLFTKIFQSITKLKIIFLTFFLSFLIAGVSNFAIIGKVFPSSSALTSGIAMHMLDAIPGYDANPVLSSSISRAEFEVRVNSPGSKFWAVQSGTKAYTDSGNENVQDELVKMDIVLLKDYPLLFVESFFGSFFSTFYDNPNAFLPHQRIQLPLQALLISYLSALFFQFTLLLRCLLMFSRDFSIRLREIRANYPTIYLNSGLFLTLGVNALVSPVEQNRYMFPLIPVMLIMCSGYFEQIKDDKDNE